MNNAYIRPGSHTTKLKSHTYISIRVHYRNVTLQNYIVKVIAMWTHIYT